MVTVLVRTDSRYPVNRKVIRQAVRDVFAQEKISSIDAEVSVSVVGSRKMKLLTDTYLKDDKEHEILTFPFEEVTETGGFVSFPDNVLRLGDIVLSWPQVLLCAAKDDIMVDEELAFLVKHGVYHLLGKHHE